MKPFISAAVNVMWATPLVKTGFPSRYLVVTGVGPRTGLAPPRVQTGRRGAGSLYSAETFKCDGMGA